MAKSSETFAKRRRERDRQEKARLKRERREERRREKNKPPVPSLTGETPESEAVS